jgi:capsid protein
VLHLHDKERGGQSRGKPLVTAIMRESRMASHYPRTELQAAIVNSLIAAFLKPELPPDAAAALFKSGDDYAQYWQQQIGHLCVEYASCSPLLIEHPAGRTDAM